MYEILTTPLFNRNIKYLSKKYPNAKKDFSDLLDNLEQGIFEGDLLQNFSGRVYKVRVGSIDQRKGKRGGFRIIYYVVIKDKTIYLAAMYAKAYQKDITEEQHQKIQAFIDRTQKNK
ncbi:putative Toxin-antitoxin system, toxin component, RelE family [Desulfamplus magnetovallimortis]|uniref:Putative Toxin-antitoxin system, toxin component, RelE family n=1 Tax=Desulfamplus magnetovallimortis TaxID=1246637 RepID=A0A1W1HDL7_9BACT|nr:type II toxin-antitoxin system RelE/ParE family toxin [Desulfamplus magnetovallimortis]SLM30569.1 putative Toxin-antitoxin system, toxin component, RelE family [Desulfamplus magnetovallimortis]